MDAKPTFLNPQHVKNILIGHAQIRFACHLTYHFLSNIICYKPYFEQGINCGILLDPFFDFFS